MRSRDTTARTMTCEEAAWLAGFFDGEGSIFSYKGGRNGNSRCWRLSIANTDLKAIEQCQKFAGCGYIRIKPVANEHHKTQYLFVVNTQSNITSVLLQLEPYLVIKQVAAKKFLQA